MNIKKEDYFTEVERLTMAVAGALDNLQKMHKSSSPVFFAKNPDSIPPEIRDIAAKSVGEVKEIFTTLFSPTFNIPEITLPEAI